MTIFKKVSVLNRYPPDVSRIVCNHIIGALSSSKVLGSSLTRRLLFSTQGQTGAGERGEVHRGGPLLWALALVHRRDKCTDCS